MGSEVYKAPLPPNTHTPCTWTALFGLNAADSDLLGPNISLHIFLLLIPVVDSSRAQGLWVVGGGGALYT